MSNRRQTEGKGYNQLIIKHVELLCRLKNPKLLEVVKKKYYPIEECLDICKRHKRWHPCAILLKRMSEYAEAVQMYLKVLSDTLGKNDMIADL